MATETRKSIIEVIKTPISFLVLILLIIEAALVPMAYSFPQHETLLIGFIIGFLILFILIIVGFSIWEPEVLSGKRSWHRDYAHTIADDIYFSLEGFLSNLEEAEQNEGWLFLASTLNQVDTPDKDFKRFCQKVSNRILRKIQSRPRINIQGTAGASQIQVPE